MKSVWDKIDKSLKEKQKVKMEKKINDFLQTGDYSQIKPFFDSLMSQKYDSFEEFTKILEESQPTFVCNTSWEIKTLNAECKNCMLLDNSCICIRCLLDGNHIQDNHQVYLNFDSNGCCDCGNQEAWNHEGFCKNHQGKSPHPEESIPYEIRETMNIIFESLKNFIITEIQNKNHDFFNATFEYLIEISQMGDGVLRLASLSFSDERFIHTILSNSYDFTFEEAKTIKTFVTLYMADDLFSSQLARIIFPYFKIFYTKLYEACHVQADISENCPIIGPLSILKQTFHLFNHLGKEEFDFDQLFREIMIITFDFFRSNPTIFESINAWSLVDVLWCNKLIIGLYFQHGWIDKIHKFYINIASTVALIEGYIQPFQKLNDLDDSFSYYDYGLFFNFTSRLYSLPFYLSKKVRFIPEIIEIFVDFLYTNDDLDHPSFLYMLHNLCISTLKNAKNPKEEFDRMIKENKKFSEFEKKIKNKENGFTEFTNVYELIYYRACLIPINIITQIMLRDFNLLNEEDYPKSYINVLYKYHGSWYIQSDFPFLLSLVQFMFSFIENKNKLLKLIESKLSIFDNNNSKSKRMFCFILIVSALILDDPKLIGKKKRNIQLSFMTILKCNPKSDSYLLDDYRCSINLNRAMKWYNQVKFDNSWHIILPFMSPRDLLMYYFPNIIHQITNDSNGINDSVLLPFPEFVDSDLIDLKSMMNSTYLYAILYDIMYDTDEPLLHQYAFNLFILLYNNEQAKNTKINKNHHSITALNIDEIVDQIPLNFIEFCDMKINYKKGGVYQSLIDLIENSGQIGLNVLHRTLHKRDENEMKQIMKKKSKIKSVKSKIINNYKKKALNFDYSKVINLATDVKVANNNKMYIFVELMMSTVPYFLEKQNHFDFSVKKIKDDDDDYDDDDDVIRDFFLSRSRLKKCLIATTCGHFSDDLINSCPHCGLIINFLLPNYNASNNPNLYSEPIQIFTDVFNNPKNYLKLLKNMIILLDFRSRLKPEVLQDEMNFLLYRNLYIFVTLHSNLIDQHSFKNQRSRLGIFLCDLIFNYDSNSLNYIEYFIQKYKEKFQYNKIDYEFLKRVELIRLFYLNQELEFVIDIDEHFSFRNLIKKYRVSEDFIVPTKYTNYQNIVVKKYSFGPKSMTKRFYIDEEQLPVFRGIDLPDNFLQIINKPFNVKMVAKQYSEKIICLATGEILKRELMNINMKIPRELTCQPVLMANGRRINAVGIWRKNYFTFHKSIYRNKKGDEDVGFNNGDPVFLDHESYIDLMDEFISGSCLSKKQNERYEHI